MTIPIELRDIVYTYTLVAKTKLRIRTGEQQPALLQISHQVRAETIELYYSDNNFCFIVHAYDGLEVHPFCKLLQQYSKHGCKNLSIGLCNRPICPECDDVLRLDHLLTWLRAYHSDKELVPCPCLRQQAIVELSLIHI